MHRRTFWIALGCSACLHLVPLLVFAVALILSLLPPDSMPVPLLAFGNSQKQGLQVAAIAIRSGTIDFDDQNPPGNGIRREPEPVTVSDPEKDPEKPPP